MWINHSLSLFSSFLCFTRTITPFIVHHHLPSFLCRCGGSCSRAKAQFLLSIFLLLYIQNDFKRYYYYEILILLFWNFSKELLLQSRLQPFYEEPGLAESRAHKLRGKITDIRINKCMKRI